jgi:hypothetical protein
MAAGFALPRDASNAVESVSFPRDNDILHKRGDEWVMVLYNEHKKGGQCGGSSRKVSGNGDSCVDIKDALCVNLKADASIGSVAFSWKRDSCKGDQVKFDVVQGGKDLNGVDLDDKIQFVVVTGRDERKLSDE